MDQSVTEKIFRPAKVGRASEDVALQIEAAILGGQLKRGERLPSERRLQGVFHSSRGVIREALRALKQKGLIEIKKGAHGGASVKDLELINASEPLALFLQQQQLPSRFLIEFRESMDRTITQLAIARGTREDKQALVDHTIHFQELIGQTNPDLKQIAEADREMNIALARMTGNPIFELIMRMTQIGFSSQDQLLYEDPEFRFQTAANWQETARRIAAVDIMKALSCISHHYFLLHQCLKKKEHQTADSLGFQARKTNTSETEDAVSRESFQGTSGTAEKK
jgi:GntR family transcriptional repressor for pyruvate dehydrogenase complex